MNAVKRITLVLVGLVALLSLVASSVNASGAGTEKVDQSISSFLIQHPGAYRVSSYQVAWNSGALLTWPDSRTGRVPVTSESRVDLRPAIANTALNVNGCPSGAFVTDKFCFYANSNFGGRMLQFADCGDQYFSNYGFENQTSSWVNTTGSGTSVWDNSLGQLWYETTNSKSAYVAAGANDRADFFRHC